MKKWGAEHEIKAELRKLTDRVRGLRHELEAMISRGKPNESINREQQPRRRARNKDGLR